MENNGHKSIRKQLDDGAVMDALRIGSKRAVRMHKLLGNPVTTTRNGKVVLVMPDEIVLDESISPLVGSQNGVK